MGRKAENPGKGKRTNKGGWEGKDTERRNDRQSKRGERHQQGTNAEKVQDSDRTGEFSPMVTAKPSYPQGVLGRERGRRWLVPPRTTIPKAALEETSLWWVLSLFLPQFIGS